MTPEERQALQRAIGGYLKDRIADANDLQCTVWADGICELADLMIVAIVGDVIDTLKGGDDLEAA